MARDLRRARAVIHVGGGYLHAIAQEATLKMIETASVPVLSYSPGGLVHGPIAAVGPDVPLVCYAAHGPMHADIERVAKLAIARSAPVMWIGHDPPAGTTRVVPLAGLVPEALMPLLHVVRAQQLALALSRAFGLDADAPPGLSKVTVTQ